MHIYIYIYIMHMLYNINVTSCFHFTNLQDPITDPLLWFWDVFLFCLEFRCALRVVITMRSQVAALVSTSLQKPSQRPTTKNHTLDHPTVPSGLQNCGKSHKSEFMSHRVLAQPLVANMYIPAWIKTHRA